MKFIFSDQATGFYFDGTSFAAKTPDKAARGKASNRRKLERIFGRPVWAWRA